MPGYSKPVDIAQKGLNGRKAMEMSLNVDAPPNAADFPRGVALLRDPLLNKGTAFSEKERDAFGLRGLLPAHLLSQEEQVARILTNLRRLPDDLEKYVALNALHDRNEALFFRVVCDNIDEIQPLIYTPTVGLACQKFGDIFQRPRGLFITSDDRGRRNLSLSLTASAFWDWATSARTAWGFPSANCHYMSPVPAFTRSYVCPSYWTWAQTTRPC